MYTCPRNQTFIRYQHLDSTCIDYLVEDFLYYTKHYYNTAVKLWKEINTHPIKWKLLILHTTNLVDQRFDFWES